MSSVAAKNRVFSGIQPTGGLHLGNYLGALKHFVQLQQDYDCIYCVVDLHALTAHPSPASLTHDTRAAAAAFIAAGLDPKAHILFNQSRIAAHAELAWLLICLTPMGWLSRMTQFKEKAGKAREMASAGLFTYPVLMAADILLYHATHVPVGEDQIQHLELAREIARKFNHDYGEDFFPEPNALRREVGGRIMSLRNGKKKMSKSAASPAGTIFLADDADMLARKIRRATSDSLPVPEKPPDPNQRPEAANLISIFSALTAASPNAICRDFAGQGWAPFKEALLEALLAELSPIAGEIKKLEAQPDYLDKILDEGAARANTIAAPILAETKKKLGLLR